MGQGFFRAGLADTAGNGGNPRACPGAPGHGEAAQSLQCISDDQTWLASEAVCTCLGYQGGCRAVVESTADKIVAIEIGPGKGDEQIASLERAGID